MVTMEKKAMEKTRVSLDRKELNQLLNCLNTNTTWQKDKHIILRSKLIKAMLKLEQIK